MENKKNNSTFYIQIKATENNSWQGVIKWVDKDKSIPFRSSLEAFCLIDSVVNGSDE